jgi:hypothetical protein
MLFADTMFLSFSSSTRIGADLTRVRGRWFFRHGTPTLDRKFLKGRKTISTLCQRHRLANECIFLDYGTWVLRVLFRGMSAWALDPGMRLIFPEGTYPAY